MNALSSAFYLIECVVLATLLTKWIIIVSVDEDRVSKFLAWIVFFFAAFFGGFYLLGYINLATNLPVVSPAYGSVVLLVAIAGFVLWFNKRIFELLKTKRNISHVRSPIFHISLPAHGLGRILAIVTLVTFVLIALMLIVGFPQGYEAQAYHLPIALNIFQTQSLKIWDTAFLHTFPANASIYVGFLLGFISEHLVAAANLVFLVPLVVAVYGLCRASGADKTASILTSLGLLTIPIIAFGAFQASADVGGAAFLAIAVYFAIAKSDCRTSHQVLCGLAAGLAFGFKSLHIVSIAFLFLLILLRTWSESRNDVSSERIWSGVRPVLIFLVSTLAMSGFWLVRNYVELGNPLYPVHLPIFDLVGWTKAPDRDFTQRHGTQFKWVRSSSEWFVYPWVEWHNTGENFKASSGLGAFFAATVPVACLISLIGIIIKDNKRFIRASLLCGGFVVFLVWWVLDAREPRYFMGALVFLVPLVAWTMSQTEGQYRKVFELIVAACILSMFFVIFSKQFVEFGTRFIYAKQFTRSAFYTYPEMIDRLPPGSTIVNFGHRTSNYLLYGKTHNNRVVNYVECKKTFAMPPLPGPDEESVASWHLEFSKLRNLGATHLFTIGHPSLLLDECVMLEEIDRMDKHPVIETPLPKPLSVYEIKYCDARINKGNKRRSTLAEMDEPSKFVNPGAAHYK